LGGCTSGLPPWRETWRKDSEASGNALVRLLARWRPEEACHPLRMVELLLPRVRSSLASGSPGASYIQGSAAFLLKVAAVLLSWEGWLHRPFISASLGVWGGIR